MTDWRRLWAVGFGLTEECWTGITDGSMMQIQGDGLPCGCPGGHRAKVASQPTPRTYDRGTKALLYREEDDVSFWIVLAAFWGLAIRLWVVDGPKLPLIFIAMWVLGVVVVVAILDLNPWLFLSYEAILTAILFVIERYKSVM
ncbi:MAG: hypothetical protein ABIH24_10145 [Verrucomicrobiota bacterium]